MSKRLKKFVDNWFIREDEEEEEINVVDLSDEEEDGYSSSHHVEPSCSRSSSIRSIQGDVPRAVGAQMPLDLSRKGGAQTDAVDCRPSVIKSQESFELPDVDEHFRKSLSFTPQQINAEAKVDDHFARALGEVWWALKAKMDDTNAADSNSPT
ncbi:Transcription cofactor vestigial-like protein 4 [Trichuris trichiura]|uniref:Transcription cofactor vestigial-like protein 4 n=1 Tax=Trichuris trichiura TaxID=36087 RepID=A0A077Z6B7_TRITR|nr:Transcription cofactor vestigial-like protein 4 [Trichuris trichiura]